MIGARMRLDPGYNEEFRTRLLRPAEFEKLNANIELIPAPDATFVAEDDRGHSYNYGTEALHWERDDIDAREWLGIEVLP